MVIAMPPKGPGGELPCKARSATDDREPARWRADRAEFLGEDGACREYWLLGGRVYAEGHGGTFPVCPLAGWGRLRKLHSTCGGARRRASAA